MSKKTINSNREDHNGIRISYHEKVCAERMKTLFNRIDEMKKDMKKGTTFKKSHIKAMKKVGV